VFNAQQFLEEYHIDIPRTAKNTSPGWVNIQCPFCDDSSNHGGFNIQGGYYNCHRCGGHWLPKVIAHLLSIPISKARQIIYRYSAAPLTKTFHKPTSFRRKQKISLPPLLGYMRPSHIAYLSDKRAFRYYHQIIRDWQLQSTGYYGDYCHRIFAPIYFEGQMVTYQCRAITDDHYPPYKACAKKDEIIHHKNIVYGFDYAARIGRCIVVEGITDVWRLGKGAIATFGKGYTKKQTQLIINNFDQIFIFLDSDVEKEKQQWDLPRSLVNLTKVNIIEIKKGDPGSLTDRKAYELMMKLGFKRR
jgi:hypothetical protein